MKPKNYTANANGFGKSPNAVSHMYYTPGQTITATIRKARVEGLVLNVAGVASAIMSTRAFGSGEERHAIIKRMRPGDRITGRVLAFYPQTNQLTLEYVPPREKPARLRKPEHKPLDAGTVCLVDTANVLGFTGPEHAACILETIAAELVSQGYKSMFFLEHRTYVWARCNQCSNAEVAALDAFVKRDDFALITDNGAANNKSEADAPILQVAEAIGNSVVVSRDHYADYSRLHPDIVGSGRVRAFTVVKPGNQTIITIDGLTRAVVVDLAEKFADECVEKVNAAEDIQPDVEEDRAVHHHGLTAIADGYLKKGDMRKAEQMYAKAAKKDPEAYRALAEMYCGGMGMNADPKKAARYERLARKLEKRRTECEKRYNRLRAQSAREGRYQCDHFSYKRRKALSIAAVGDGHAMICEYFRGTKYGRRIAYGRAA